MKLHIATTDSGDRHDLYDASPVMIQLSPMEKSNGKEA